ncbi:MAG: lysophospholipid acyltransferase family protein [Clostridia bacterium]|nr:lysophospholipid acyltransferase family protein [Clostridia bacterium]
MNVVHMLHEGLGVVIRGVLRPLIYAAFRPKCTFVSEEAKHCFREEPCVIIYNHVTVLDGALMALHTHRNTVRMLAAKDILDKNPALGFLCSFLWCVPIERHRFSLQWMRESRRYLKQGYAVGIAPEGKCHHDRVMYSFKPGFAAMASTCDVKVVPVFHNGRYNYFFGKRFRMIVGEPFTLKPAPEGLEKDELDAACRRAEDIMHDLEMRLNGCIRTGEGD